MFCPKGVAFGVGFVLVFFFVVCRFVVFDRGLLAFGSYFVLRRLRSGLYFLLLFVCRSFGRLSSKVWLWRVVVVRNGAGMWSFY